MHVVGTAGHVDHGKSSLVQALTGIDPDRFEEEKRRGLTIDLGFAWLTLPSGREVGIVDVPGHERFIKNMLAGAGGISVCLFVVAANEGWMPQSSEHLAAIQVLGIEAGIIAVTKADAVDEDLLELAVAEVQEHLEGTTLEKAPIVCCSAHTGAGLEKMKTTLDEVLSSAPASVDVARPRLFVDRVFTIAGAGTVVTGTLTGGTLTVGDQVQIVPENRTARIRGIQTHKRKVERIAPGNRVALNLAGLQRQGAERGAAVVKKGHWRATGLVHANVEVLPARIIGIEYLLTEKGAHLLHVGSAETPVRIKLLENSEIAPGSWGMAELRLRDPLALARGDRFVLRDAGRALTFGGGEILDPLATTMRRRNRRGLEILQRLRTDEPSEALTALVDSAGIVSIPEALMRAGSATPGSGVVLLGDSLVSERRLQDLVQSLRAELEHHHAESPLEKGMTRETLRAALGLEAGTFDALIVRLEDVISEGPTVSLSSFSVELSVEEKRARDEVIATIDASGFSPPMTKDLPADAGLLRALTAAGELVKIDDFYLTGALATEAKARVRARIEESGPITVAEIRDLLGTSRKYAVPLCEWLDDSGATRRRGDLRGLGPNL
ncbi:MAG: selenocysteine-specific translation elongation factor [Actinomycetota bacterium]|nr:selenocysteine-specific translation elongation factor [Actinomycetota bacterium]